MSTRLFVVVPGIKRRISCWAPLLERLKRDNPGSSWLVHDHRGSVGSTRSILGFAADLAAEINQRVIHDKPEKVTLIGHSFGGVLVRMAYLIAHGRMPMVSTNPMPWAQSVDRIVLFAAMNRGFDPDRMGFVVSHLVRLLLLVPVFRLGRGLMKGSDAMTDLRIAWIRLFRDLGDRQPVVIQLHGTRDHLVLRDDSTDVEQFPKARQELVAGATHEDLYTLPAGREEERYGFLKAHILETPGVPGSADTVPETTDVVFLIHGIRASNSQWPEHAHRLLQDEHPTAIGVPAGYGYFSALNFAVPFLRRRQIRWLQDEYSYRFAKHPNAKFHFLGHSNGTYLLGHALRRVPSIRFERVALAGSVLPETFEWSKYLGTRVQQYRNHRASRDRPVAILCSFLRGLGMKDVGTAGFDGFTFADQQSTREFFYYQGDHSAALRDEISLRRLLAFCVTGRDEPFEPPLPQTAPRGLMAVSRAVRQLAWPLVLLMAYGIWKLGGVVGHQVAAAAPFTADYALATGIALVCVAIGVFLKVV